jgi:hypothetical protein
MMWNFLAFASCAIFAQAATVPLT